MKTQAKTITPTQKKGFQMEGIQILGSSLSACGDFEITKNTYYNLLGFSAEATGFKDKIVKWIGKSGIYLERDGKVLEDKELTKKVQNIFKAGTRQNFKDRYFTHNFCSGDIYMFARENLAGEKSCQIVDSRTIVKKVDDNGNIIGFRQLSVKDPKTYTTDQVYNSIVRYNPENPYYGKSMFQSIVYDALSDTESSKRQFYFFKNDALPNALFLLNPEIAKNKDATNFLKREIQEKYRGSHNSHKIMLGSGITDVKLLELSNKDLDLLNLRNFITKKRGVIFQIDPRLIGFMMDSGADRSIQSIRDEAKETVMNLAAQFEEDLNNFYHQYIDPNANFVIKVDSEEFIDRQAIEENQRKDIAIGLLTLDEARVERGQEPYNLENTNKPLTSSTTILVEQIANNNFSNLP